MKSRLFLLLVGLSLLAACGGSKSSSSSSSGGAVTISPSTASVATNTTAQFNATVTNSSSGVYWSVNGVIGGNTAAGTITTGGLYTAPAVVPSPATVTITATSLSDTTQSASATVTITAGTAISFTISPSTVSVYTGRTQQFSTTFNVSANTTVTWEVNSTIGGDATHGTISSTGLYTAPPTVPSPAQVTITAVSQADPSKTATATVTVVLGSTIAISPVTANVPAGGTLTLNATSSNGSTTNPTPIAVTWSLNCNSTATNGCGTITTAGGTANATATYTAPAFPPPGGGAVSITATSTDQSALPGSANIVVQVSNGSLVGTYAYSFAGKNNGTPYSEAGSVTFDGQGGVTSGGSADINAATQTTANITGGSYHVGVDGRGNASIITSSGTETWQIVVKDNTKAYMMRGDSGVTGTGTLYLQDTNKFSMASISGNYGLRLSGPAQGQTGSAAVVGAVTASGAGVITSGKIDISQGAIATPALPATGVYGAPSSTTGRGVLTITTTSGARNFAYYIVNATRAILVETDAGQNLRGELVAQAIGPFTAVSFANSYAMALSGANGSNAPAIVGSVFTLDGAGNISSGVADVNTNGTATNGAMTGTYAVTDATTGRTELTVNINAQPRKFVLYPEATGTYNALEIDGVQTTVGRAYVQVSNVTAGLWSGTYEGATAGTDFINSPGEKDAVGLFIPNGGSAVGGTLDVNSSGTVSTAVALTGSYVTTTTAGRLTGSTTTNPGTLLSGQIVVYIVDANHALIMESDSTRTLVGLMEK